MKTVFYAIGYFIILFPTLLAALDEWVEMADPSDLNPKFDHTFWLSGFGECLWFGFAFALPALILMGFRYATRGLVRFRARGKPLLSH